MKMLWDSEVGFFELPIWMAHEAAWEAEEPWRMHGPFAFEVIAALTCGVPIRTTDGDE